MPTQTPQDAATGDSIDRLARWWHWPAYTAALWLIPGSMTLVWIACYAPVFGEPGPYYPWSAAALDALAALNLAAVAAYVYRLNRDPIVYVILGVLAVPAEVAVTLAIWDFGRASVGGFYY